MIIFGKGTSPRRLLLAFALIAGVLANLAVVHKHFLQETLNLFAYDAASGAASSSALAVSSGQSGELDVVETKNSVIKVFLEECSPIERGWIDWKESSLYLVSDCIDVDRLLGPHNQTIIQELSAKPDFLVCVLSEMFGNRAAQCLAEARDRQATIVFPTEHSLSPMRFGQWNLIPGPVISQRHETQPSMHNNITVLYHACETVLDPIVISKVIPAYTKRLLHLLECDSDRSSPTFLQGLYPLATITTCLCPGGDCLEAMQNAQHIVCLSLSCVLPSIISRHNVTLVLADAGIFGNATFQSNLQLLASSDVSSSCIHLQGRVGRWKYNESNIHETHRYWDPRWIRDQRNLTDRRHSKFGWQDDYCPMPSPSLMTRQRFCAAMQQLGFGRLFIIGDSLQFMTALSFLNQLGFKGIDLELHQHLYRPKMRSNQTVECSPDFTFEMIFHRYNHLWPNYADRSLLGDEIGQDDATRTIMNSNGYAETFYEVFQCQGGPHRSYPDKQGFCPWVYDYLNYTGGKTLFWANVGAHFHQLYLFRESMQGFASFLQSHPRPDDWIVLRTLAPGHDNCSTALDPYSSFQEYYATNGNTTTFDWNLFTEYNRITEEVTRKLTSIRRQQQEKQYREGNAEPTVARVDLHDIYWMTALRKDGHPSKNDCLHYLLPGPPDWWVQTLYSMLEDRIVASMRQ